MLAIGTRVRFVTAYDLEGTVIGHTFYKRNSWAVMEPGYVVELDHGKGGYMENANPLMPKIFVDTLVAHVTSVMEAFE